VIALTIFTLYFSYFYYFVYLYSAVSYVDKRRCRHGVCGPDRLLQKSDRCDGCFRCFCCTRFYLSRLRYIDDDAYVMTGEFHAVADSISRYSVRPTVHYVMVLTVVSHGVSKLIVSVHGYVACGRLTTNLFLSSQHLRQCVYRVDQVSLTRPIDCSSGRRI